MVMILVGFIMGLYECEVTVYVSTLNTPPDVI